MPPWAARAKDEALITWTWPLVTFGRRLGEGLADRRGIHAGARAAAAFERGVAIPPHSNPKVLRQIARPV